MSLILSLVSGLGRKIDMSPFLVTLFAFELTGEKILDAEHSPCARASSGAPFAFRNWDLSLFVIGIFSTRFLIISSCLYRRTRNSLN